MIRPDSFRSHTHSKFFHQLTELEHSYGSKAAITAMKNSVNSVCEDAVNIAKDVRRWMPHFTLHDETHFLNVLWIMGELVPETTLKRMHPLECALCIMSAYVHDLGMAMSKKEYEALADPATEAHRRYEAAKGENSELLEYLAVLEGCPGAGREAIGQAEGLLIVWLCRIRLGPRKPDSEDTRQRRGQCGLSLHGHHQPLP